MFNYTFLWLLMYSTLFIEVFVGPTVYEINLIVSFFICIQGDTRFNF